MTESARAVVFRGPGQPLELVAVGLPKLGTGEALVRLDFRTLCGSDLHTYRGRRSTPVPTVLGHEAIGTVVATGKNAGIQEGARVTWSVAASCGSCFFCSHELPQKCERLFKYGHEKMRDVHPLSGGLATHCHLARGTTVVEIPSDLPNEVACPANCATATIAAALRTAGDIPGAVVLVLGAGMLGLTAAAMCRTRGARAVIVSEPDAKRRALAAAFGASVAVDPGELEELLEETHRRTRSGHRARGLGCRERSARQLRADSDRRDGGSRRVGVSRASHAARGRVDRSSELDPARHPQLRARRSARSGLLPRRAPHEIPVRGSRSRHLSARESRRSIPIRVRQESATRRHHSMRLKRIGLRRFRPRDVLSPRVELCPEEVSCVPSTSHLARCFGPYLCVGGGATFGTIRNSAHAVGRSRSSRECREQFDRNRLAVG